MAKRRENEVKEGNTKKLKQAPKAKSSGAREKLKGAGNGITNEEEKLERKVKPKPCTSSKQAKGNPPSSASTATTGVKTSRYFKSPVNDEKTDSEEDFDIVTSAVPPALMNDKKTGKDDDEEDSEEEDDWEEVEELMEPLGSVEPPEPVLPTQPVEIEIETPEVRKRQKRQAELESYLRRMMNRYKKDLLIDTHKVHVMCLIASGMFRNRLCSEPDLLAITLSLLPTHFGMVAKERIDQNYLSGLLKWFRATFTLNPSLPCEEGQDPRALMERRLASLSANNHREMTHLFLLVLRSLQLFCRLVLSLQPIPLKFPSAKGKGAAGGPGKSITGKEASKTNSPVTMVSPGTKRTAGRGKTIVERGGKKAKRTETKKEDEEKAITSGGQRPKNSKRRSVASKVSYKEESNSEVENNEKGLSDEEEFQVSSEKEDSVDSESGAEFTQKMKGKGKNQSKVTKCKNTSTSERRSTEGRKTVKDQELEGVDDNEGEGATSNGTKKISRKKKEKPGGDDWLEVFLDKTSSWICVDVEHGIGMPHLCSQNATEPVTYVVSIDGDGFVKDLGRKYDPTWMTSTRKRRVDEEWWEDTLEPFLGPEDDRDTKEDEELQKKLLNKPLPISVGEFKNHPLYALKRHLLKYEAIYPSTATVLGYCRGEPVYSRDCVHTLHSKDTWLKEARTVRLGEEPYKSQVISAQQSQYDDT